SFKGAWGIYPYLPSGNIIVSDMQTGLYIFDCSSSTSIIENTLSNNIFPNPAKTQFMISNSNAESITLYNTLGMKVYEQKLTKNQNTIYRGNLSNGLYFYTLIKEGKRTESGKVIFE
ncbi:MAG: T9SS type A sorting domain-containing protein, partial [Flavobacteriales bacterium]|nr:T9SS type A sorting domain-containing protein [Flavobacteriales bacterium]